MISVLEIGKSTNRQLRPFPQLIEKDGIVALINKRGEEGIVLIVIDTLDTMGYKVGDKIHTGCGSTYWKNSGWRDYVGEVNIRNE